MGVEHGSKPAAVPGEPGPGDEPLTEHVHDTESWVEDDLEVGQLVDPGFDVAT